MAAAHAQKIILGTRGSALALKQADMVTAALQSAWPALQIERKIIATAGDKRPDLRFAEFSTGPDAAPDKGIFIKELEIALEQGEIDAAVHSLKDVPSELAAGFMISAVLERAVIEDVLVTREPWSLAALPPGARVGTSSVRRARQLKWLRPDVEIIEIRGNVPTRVKKVADPDGVDAVLLAAAGLLRLGLLDGSQGHGQCESVAFFAQVLDAEQFIPAAGQGAVGIETRANDAAVQQLLAGINHTETLTRVMAEREFLRLLGAGCQTPVGARTWITGDELHMAARVFPEHDPAAAPIDRTDVGSTAEPKALAARLARAILNQA